WVRTHPRPIFRNRIHCRKCRPGLILLVYLFFVRIFLRMIRGAPGRIDDRVLCIKLPKSETQRAQSKHREPQRNPAVSLRSGLIFYSTDSQCPLWLFSVSSVLNSEKRATKMCASCKYFDGW